MKILFISRDFPNMSGGVSDYTYHLSNALSENMFEIYVLTSKDKRVISQQKNNINILPVTEKWNVKSLLSVIEEINKIKPNRVMLQYVPYMYAHYGMPIYIAILAVILNLLGFKLLTTFHEIAIRLYFRKPKYWIIGFFQRLIAYVICISSNKIVVSNKHYKDMLWLFGKKISLVAMGSNILPIDVSDSERAQLKKKISPPADFIISSFGSNPRKNDLLLDVIKRFKDEGILIKLLFIGNYPRDWVQSIKIAAKEKNIEDLIYITGLIEPQEVYKHLTISDVFIQLENIDRKGWGGVSTRSTTLAAAYAAGLPIIGNQGEMTDDFFHNKENILLIDSLNIYVLFSAIKSLMRDKELQQTLRNGALQTFKMQLDWKVIVNKYMVLLNN